MTPQEKVEKALAALGWSETRLADEAGVDRPAVHHWLNGEMNFGAVRLGRIAAALEDAGQPVLFEETELTPRPLLHEVKRLDARQTALARDIRDLRRRLAQPRLTARTARSARRAPP